MGAGAGSSLDNAYVEKRTAAGDYRFHVFMCTRGLTKPDDGGGDRRGLCERGLPTTL